MNVCRRAAIVASIVLAVAGVSTAGQDVVTVLAEGFGWAGAAPVSPATHVLAEGFGWAAVDLVDPGTWA
jgi:hypothetical protein